MKRLAALLLLAFALVTVGPAPDAHAEDATWTVDPLTPTELPPPGEPPPEEDVEPLTYKISSHLRCPVCQGLSVADSPSNTAVAMKGRVRELVEQGYTREQIDAYFVGRYGEWVLLSPPANGLAWLLWLGPAVLLGLVLVWSVGTVMGWRRKDDEVPLPSDVGLAPKDPYEARLLAELEEDSA